MLLARFWSESTNEDQYSFTLLSVAGSIYIPPYILGIPSDSIDTVITGQVYGQNQFCGKR